MFWVLVSLLVSLEVSASSRGAVGRHADRPRERRRNEAGLCRAKRGAPSGPGHPNQDTGVFTVAEVRRLLAVAGEVRNSANRGRSTQDFSGRTDNFLGCPMERMALVFQGLIAEAKWQPVRVPIRPQRRANTATRPAANVRMAG